MALLGVWDPNRVYFGQWEDDDHTVAHNGGADRVLWRGALWEANYYSNGLDPLYDEPGNSGAWRIVSGSVNMTPVAPEAPLNLEAVYASQSSVTLYWDVAEVKGLGNVTHYNVYLDGAKVGTTDGTSFTVKGLDAGTTYDFTVKAVDFTGSSVASTELHAATNGEEILSGKTYSPYIDMTLPHVNLTDLARESGVKDFTLAFMQTTREQLDDDGVLDLLPGEKPSLDWGGVERTTMAAGVIQKQVAQIEKLGGTVTVAFGGYTGREAAVIAHQYADYLDQNGGLSATAAMNKAIAHLTSEYQSVIDTYGVDHLDFDIENAVYNYDDPPSKLYAVVNDTVANHMRNVAINRLEIANKDLHVSFTLPVTVNGFNSNPSKPGGDVLRVLEQAVADKVDIDLVNIMAMDYFDGHPEDMGQKAIDAAIAVHTQLLNMGLDAKVGIVPMIGVNDNLSEVFTLEDAQQVLDFAAANDWVGNIGIWQLPRDRPSDLKDEHGDTLAPISTGSGIDDQDAWEFSDIFGRVTRQATSKADTITGNDSANKLRGLGGSDTINAKGGNDTVQGGSGKDTMDGGTGSRDVLDYSDKTKAVELTLNGATQITVKVDTVAEDKVKNFEDVIGGSASDKLTGNAGINYFTGGGGKDVLVGAGGADHFRFTLAPSTTNIDTIDFKHDEDLIDLKASIFSALGSSVTAAELRIVTSGHAAADSNDRLIYNKTDGKLWYDADANGSGAALQIALLSTKPALIDAGDFAIV